MSKLWVVGDSTLSAFDDKFYYPRYGYGTALGYYLDQEIEVRNLALPGRSSKSFLEEKVYKELLDGMAEGDFLLIAFGHNDEKAEKSRFTSPLGDYKTEESFAKSLYDNYILKAKEAKACPILAPPFVRRSAEGIYEGENVHITSDNGQYPGGDYAKAIRDLGQALGIYLVDMTEITKEFYIKLGAEETKNLHAWPSNKEMSVDDTHTNIWGARVNAYFFLSQVEKLGIKGLSEHVCNLEKDAPYPSKETYLKINEDYKPVEFKPVLEDSKIFPSWGQFKATAFGDLSHEPNSEDFVFEPISDNSFRIAVKNNVGKISNVTDGLAMYYRKVPANAEFELSTKIKINDFYINKQVSFGLMVRDDIYLDKVISECIGDFVAAGPLELTDVDSPKRCFARKNGRLINGGKCSHGFKPGDELELKIIATKDGYACKLGDQDMVSGGFDFKLTQIDPTSVYVGAFVSRNADVTFTDLELKMI